MGHVVFALFDDPQEADRAMHELDELDPLHRKVHFAVHRDGLDTESLELGETGGRSRMFDGVLLGGAIGAAFGAVLLGPSDLTSLGILGGAVFCGGMGMLIGALGGALSGVAGPDPNLAHLAEELRAGKVLLTVDATGPTAVEEAELIVKRHGARIEHHAAI